jgi:hypothetical protein
VVDDDPAPVVEWLPALAETLGTKKPMFVPRAGRRAGDRVGVAGGEEEGVGGEGVARERLYTAPEELLRVAEVLGTGERGRYLRVGRERTGSSGH